MNIETSLTFTFLLKTILSFVGNPVCLYIINIWHSKKYLLLGEQWDFFPYIGPDTQDTTPGSTDPFALITTTKVYTPFVPLVASWGSCLGSCSMKQDCELHRERICSLALCSLCKAQSESEMYKHGKLQLKITQVLCSHFLLS